MSELQQQEPEPEQFQSQQSYSQNRQTQWEPPLATSTPSQASCSQPQRKKLIYRPSTPVTDCSMSEEDSIDDQLQNPVAPTSVPKTRIPYVPSSQTDSCTSDEFDDSQTASDISASGNKPANVPLQPTYSCICTSSYPNSMPGYPIPSDTRASRVTAPCPQLPQSNSNKSAKNDERRRLCEFTTEYYYITPQDASKSQQDPNTSTQRTPRNNTGCYGNARPVQSSPSINPENYNQQRTPQR